MTTGGLQQIWILLHQNRSIGTQSDGFAQLFQDFLHRRLVAKVCINDQGWCAPDFDALAPKQVNWQAKRWSGRAFRIFFAQAAGRKQLHQ